MEQTGRLNITRRAFCSSALAGAAAMAAGSLAACAETQRPNILLVTADDLGLQLGCFGDAQARTPHLDALALEGVRFRRAFVTQASCSPSRSSIFTGLYPHQNGQIGLAHVGYSMHEGVEVLPALLKQAGYRTGVIGKVHVAPDQAFPFDMDRRSLILETRDVERVAALASLFMGQAKEHPFFLMVNYFDPHRPYDLDQVKGIPEQLMGPDDVKPLPFLGLDAPDVRLDAAKFYNAVARMDAGVGLLLNALTKTGRDQDTIVIFLGDNGPPFTRAKTTCYEAGLATPLIIRWPAHAKAGTVCDELVSMVDLVPTLCEAAGIAAPNGVAGQPVQPLLAGGQAPWRTTLCAEYTSHAVRSYFPRRSIRDAQYKLILNLAAPAENPVKGVDGCHAWAASRDAAYEGALVREVYDRYAKPPRVELYDLEQDPYEFHNVAGDAAYTAVQERLSNALEAWRKQTQDPLLDPVDLDDLTRRHGEIKGPNAKWKGETP